MANYNITLKSYRNKMSQLGWQLKSLISISSNPLRLRRRHVTSRQRLSRHALGRCIVSTLLVRVDVVDVADTSSRHCVNIMNIFLRLKLDQESIRVHFEIFFLKTDKLKSVFKLRLTSPGRKLWPILVYCILKANKLFKFNFKDSKSSN